MALILLIGAGCSSDTVDLDGGVARPDGSGLTPDGAASDGSTPDVTVAPDASVPPEPCGSVLGTTCPDGAACQFSGDCQAGSICNTTDDPFYDPSGPVDVCVRLVCEQDADCEPGEVCTLERLCAPRGCQVDGDCMGGELCSAGTCGAPPPPSEAARCTVLTRDGTVQSGGVIPLTAQVFDRSGRAIAGVPLLWRSSEPSRVAAVGATAVGGAVAGVAELRAEIAGSGLACTGVVRIENVAPSVGARVRVRVQEARSGAALPNARVVVDIDGRLREALSDAAGLAEIAGVMGDPLSVTVSADEHEFLTLIGPLGPDLVVPLERRPDHSRTGGFRGVIDMSTARGGDLAMGFVGAALPSDLSTFHLGDLLGDTIRARIDAPQIGLNNQETSIPGGVVMSLGNVRLTADVAAENVRCQGTDPVSTELGCFVARAPAGPGAGWVLAHRFKLQDVAALAGVLSTSMGDDPLAGLVAIIPLFATARHGILAQLDTIEAERVSVAGVPTARCSSPDTPDDDAECRGDYARFAPVRAELVAAQSVMSVVTVPVLPRTVDGRFARGALVFAAADAGRRGLVPLGVAIGEDVTTPGNATPDGIVAANRHPFGPLSPAGSEGEVALRSAVPHSGLEGLSRRLVAVAFDESTTTSDGGTRTSGLIAPVTRLGGRADFGGRTFLPYATGTLVRGSASFRGTLPRDATFLRIELRRGRDVWRILAPPSSAGAFALPAVAAARSALLDGNAAPRLSLHAFISATPYTALFTPGAARLGDVTVAFSAHDCGTESTAACHVE